MSDRTSQRRDTSLAGTWRRTQYELSLKSIGTFGFSARVAEYCRHRARGAGCLPHELVLEIVEETVLRAIRTA
jgi:hypothetical protein